MADIVDKATRSRYMAAVKSFGNLSTEAKMAILLRSTGLKGWRRHYPLPGKPDFCWKRQKVVLFVDGCFWHGCPRCYKTPKSNIEFWRNKVETNRARDKKINSILRRNGWVVIRVWECQLRFERTVRRIERLLRKRGWRPNFS